MLMSWLPDALVQPVTETREQLQRRLLDDYIVRRDAELADRYQALSRWADPAADVAAYDEQHLLVCDLCAIATAPGPRPF